MTLHILTDDGFLVVTGNIVPLDAVSIEVVQDGQAGLRLPALLDLLPVVRLGPGWVEAPCGRPVVEGGPAVCGREPGLVGRPEPAVDVLGEEVGSVAAVKVTQTARGPEVRHVGVDKALDPLVFLSGLEGDEVHAPLPAVVPGVEPVPLGVPHPRVRVLPAEPVIATIKLVNTVHLGSDFAEVRVTEAKFSFVFFISATVSWEQLVSSFRPQGIDCAGAKEDLPDSTGERSEKVHDRSKKII